VLAGAPLTVIDKNVAEWFHERRTPGLTTTMQLVPGLGSPTSDSLIFENRSTNFI
jgi:hypothetical protein